MGGALGRPSPPDRKEISKSQRSLRRLPSNPRDCRRHERAIKPAKGCGQRSNTAASNCSGGGDGDKLSQDENEYDDKLYNLFRTFYLWGSSWEKGDIMTSKIKRSKQTCPKRQGSKRPCQRGEPWWERLSRSKRSTSCNGEMFRSFNWWQAQKRCGCKRGCIHEMANRCPSRCVDLQASVERLSKPRNPSPSVLSPERNQFRSFNWWRACRARDKLIPPVIKVAPLLNSSRRRLPASPDRCSDSSSTTEKVYRTFSWWPPSRGECRRGRGRSPGRARSLSLDTRSRRSGSGDERRERSLSPGRRRLKPDDAPCPSLFRTFSWWQLPGDRCCRSDGGSPPAKLRRRVSFHLGERDASGDRSPCAGDVAPGWKRTVVDSRLEERRTMPSKPEPCRQRVHVARSRLEQMGCPKPVRSTPPPAAGGDKQTTAKKTKRLPEKTIVKKVPPVVAKGSKSETSTSTRKTLPRREKSPPRSKSPGRPKSPAGQRSPIRPGSPQKNRARSSPPRTPSPVRTQSEPEPVLAPLKSDSESADSDYTESSASTSTTSSASRPTSAGGASSQKSDGGMGGSPGPGSPVRRESPRISPGPGSPQPGSPGRGSPRPASAGRISPISRPLSGVLRTSRSGSVANDQEPFSWEEMLKGWLSMTGLDTFSPHLPSVAAKTKCKLAAGLLCLLVGYVSVNHWRDFEELLGMGPEDPCGKPENTYFCI